MVKKEASPKPKVDREAYQKCLLDRQKESERTKNFSGKSIYKSEKVSNVSFYSPKAGDHLIDIIPHITGENHPTIAPGKAQYYLDIWVHYGLNDDNSQCLCLSKNFGKKCPICEHQKQLREEGADDKVWKNIGPKRRTIYNIVSFDSEKEQSKGVQLWNVAHFYMEMHLTKLMKGPVRPGRKVNVSEAYIIFSDPDEGRSVAFSIEDPKSKDDFPKYVGHRFVDRDYSIPDEQLAAAICLDDLLHIPSYNEVYELYWGEKVGSKVKENKTDEVEDEIAEIEEETDEVEEVEAPAPTRSGRKPAKSEPEPEIEEEVEKEIEEEIEEEEKPAPTPKKNKVKKAASAVTCPMGFEYAVEFDTYEECDDCPEDTWTACKKAHKG